MTITLPGVLLLSVLTATALAQPKITDYRIEVQYNTGKISEDIVADIYGDTLIVGIIPAQVTDLNLKATFETDATTVQAEGIDQQSTVTANDFSSDIIYTISSGAGSRNYKIRLVHTGLPLVYVYTTGAVPITSKEDYVTGTVRIYPSDGSAAYAGTMKIKGRGNTTWTFPKKPYRIKLDSKAGILGMPSEKDWVLLANYADKTLMRNSIAYDLGSQMKFAYTPRTTHVDVILNGRYQGNYVMGEHIKVASNRVNITELDPEDIDEEKITGGYFLELDDYRDGIYFELGSGLPFVMKSPDEDIPQEQMDYIKNYMQTTEDVIFSDDFNDPQDGYSKYINPETFIEWYWVMEVLKNIDAQDVSSIFYYKERGQKLNMGPLWDLDVASGNASVNGGDDPTGFYVRESKWFKRLFEDSVFKAAAEKRWFELKDDLLPKLPQMINDYSDKLELSQKYNFYRWNILNQEVWPSPVVVGSYEGEVDYLMNWLSDRIDWIDSQIERPEDPEVVTQVGNMDYGVSTFPNPASKELYIAVASHAGIDSAHLVDALGRTAAVSNLTPGITTKIDVSHLQRGMYILILRGKIDEPLTHKVLLR